MQTSSHETKTSEPDSKGCGRILRLVLLALGIALLLRVFMFEAFRIPSESMEETLLVGDFVFVSKLAYGPRLPGRLQLPFTGWAFGFRDPGPRLPGFSSIHRGDVIVFNAPAGLGPIEERSPTIKRVVGLPGDAVEIREGRLFVNGTRAREPATLLRLWKVNLDAGYAMPSPKRMTTLGITGRVDRTGTRPLVEATRKAAERLSREPGVGSVVPVVRGPDKAEALFPAALHYGMGRYGPLILPRAGWTIPLTDSTWARYHQCIRSHEGVDIRRGARGFEVGNAPADSFTFRQNYLFVLGDHRSGSTDSRTWGFVPVRHVIGRAALIYFSWDGANNALRWNRVLRPIR